MTVRIRIENVHPSDKPVVEVETMQLRSGDNAANIWVVVSSTVVPMLEIREFYIHSGQSLYVKEIP